MYTLGMVTLLHTVVKLLFIVYQGMVIAKDRGKKTGTRKR